MLFAYYDAAPDPTPVYIFLGVFFGWLALILVWPLIESAARWLWRRVEPSASVELRVPAFVVATVEALGRAVSAVRYVLNPAAERRRRLGRYLAALPRHSGLTVYEEYEAEIMSLPAGPIRSALRHNFKMMMPKPTADIIEKARLMRGRSRVPEGYVRCLLRGEKPNAYIDVA